MENFVKFPASWKILRNFAFCGKGMQSFVFFNLSILFPRKFSFLKKVLISKTELLQRLKFSEDLQIEIMQIHIQT